MFEAIGTIFILAAVVEAVITYVVPKNNTDEPREWLKYVSAVLGIVVCVAYNADILATLGVVSSVPYIGAVITGLIVGRGSNFLNDFYAKVKTPTRG
jgi:hypothetical protein